MTMENSTDTNSAEKYTSDLPGAVPSDTAAPLPQTKLLVEADDLMEDMLANLALKLFILLSTM